MEVFFNELSIRVASSNEEAKGWLTTLAELGQLLKRIIDSMDEDSFRFRRKDDFSDKLITQSESISEFLRNYFEPDDPIITFIYGIFDSPCITPDDPQRSDFECRYMTFENQTFEESGLIAAFLKESLAVSLDSDPKWDTCEVIIKINKINDSGQDAISDENIKHASKKKHVIDCHLPFLADIFDWSLYKPKFDYENRNQNLLPMLEIYSLYLGEKGSDEWKKYYSDIASMLPTERVAKIKLVVEKISKVQKWNDAPDNLKRNNRNRMLYSIHNSDLILSVDTQHGDFEIFRNPNNPVHQGSISFDGKKFKEPASEDHKLNF